MTKQEWQRMPSWDANGERMYPIMAKGARANPTLPGGVINVFFVNPDLDNWVFNVDERCAFITWEGTTVEFVQVSEPYRRRGIATEMFRLAQTACPGLRHSDELNGNAKMWIAGMEAKRT